jgi:hypothetical protein
MMARREFELGAAAIGVLMQPRCGDAKASQPATNVNFDVPAGACDCHTHIHGDPARFSWFAERTYTPETALPEEMAALHKTLKIQRVVIVTPSVYGADNSATIYASRRRGSAARIVTRRWRSRIRPGTDMRRATSDGVDATSGRDRLLTKSALIKSP